MNKQYRLLAMCVLLLLGIIGFGSPNSTQAAATKTPTPTPSIGTLAIIVGLGGGSTGMGNELYVLNTDAKNGKSLKKFGTTNSGEFTNVSWSPDGNHLIFFAIDPPGVTIVDADGGNPQTNVIVWPVFAWTPDGTQITSAQKLGPDWTIGNNDLTGANSQSLFTVKNMRHVDYIRWSPDGKWLAYVGTPAGNTVNGEELHIVDASGNNDQVIVPAGTIERNAMWSPDSQKIAYIGDGGAAGTGLTTVDLASKAKKVVAAQAVAADWSPDGSQFAYATQGGQLFVVNADGTKPHQITRPADLKGQIVAIAWRPLGNPNAPTATAASTRVATAASTSAANAVAAATISADVQASLTQTFVAKNGAFSFQYPAGWNANDQTGSDGLPTALLINSDSSIAMQFQLVVSQGQTPKAVLKGQSASSLLGAPTGEIMELRLEDRDAARVDYAGGSAFIIVAFSNGHNGEILWLLAKTATITTVEPTLLAITASFHAPASSK